MTDFQKPDCWLAALYVGTRKLEKTQVGKSVEKLVRGVDVWVVQMQVPDLPTIPKLIKWHEVFAFPVRDILLLINQTLAMLRTVGPQRWEPCNSQAEEEGEEAHKIHDWVRWNSSALVKRDDLTNAFSLRRRLPEDVMRVRQGHHGTLHAPSCFSLSLAESRRCLSVSRNRVLSWVKKKSRFKLAPDWLTLDH